MVRNVPCTKNALKSLEFTHTVLEYSLVPDHSDTIAFN